MLMPIYDNEWDDKYHEATRDMKPRELDIYLHGLIGAMSPFLNADTVDHCLRIADRLHKSDLHLVKGRV